MAIFTKGLHLRSLKAHLKSGFQVLDTLHYEGSNWHIVIWDWNNSVV